MHLNFPCVWHAQTIAQRWDQHRQRPGLEVTVASCGGRAQYEAFHRLWLKNSKCPHFAGHWELYKDMGIFMNSLKDDGRMDEFQNMLKVGFDNANRTVSLESIFRNAK